MNQDRKRSDNTELHSTTELEAILTTEAQRSVPASKMKKHFVNFQALVALLESLNLDPAIFRQKPSDYKSVSEQTALLIDNLATKLLSLTTQQLPLSLLNQLYDYLSEEDPLGAADLIFVPGSKTELRINKAIELYKLGLAPTILISGKAPFYKNNLLTQS